MRYPIAPRVRIGTLYQFAAATHNVPQTMAGKAAERVGTRDWRRFAHRSALLRQTPERVSSGFRAGRLTPLSAACYKRRYG